MNTNNLQTQHQNLATFRSSAHSDEIDLNALIRNLAIQWKLILAVTVVFTVISIGYAIIQPDIYKVESTLTAPSVGDLARITEQNLVNITPQIALDRTIEALLSNRNQAEVFKESDLAVQLMAESELSPEQMFLSIRPSLSIEREDHDIFLNQELPDDLRKEIKLSLESKYPLEATAYIQELVNFALTQTVSEIEKDVAVKKSEKIQSIEEELAALTNAVKSSREAEIARREESNTEAIAELELELSLLKSKSHDRRLNRIAALKEALKTAQALDIDEPVIWISESTNQNSTLTPMALTWLQDNYPEFYRGTKHLNAEINMLQERKDDLIYLNRATEIKAEIEKINSDPALAALKERTNDTIYIGSYNELQTRLVNIQRQPSVFPNAIVANIIQPAVIPPDSLRPNRKLIVVAGVILGAFFAFFIALIRLTIAPTTKLNN